MKKLIFLLIVCCNISMADQYWQFLREDNTLVIRKSLESKVYFFLKTPKEASPYVFKDSLNNPYGYHFTDWELIDLCEGWTLRFTSADTDSIPTPENSFHPWDIRIYEVERKYSVDSSRTIILQENIYLLETDAAIIHWIYIAAVIPFVCFVCFGVMLLIGVYKENKNMEDILTGICTILIVLLIIAIPIAAIKYGSFLIIIYSVCLFFVPFLITFVIIFIVPCLDFKELWIDIKNYFKKK